MVADEVIQVIADVLQLSERKQSLDLETPLLDGLPEFDSATVIALIEALEARFDIFFEDEDVDATTFATVGSVVVVVEAKLA